MSEAMASESSVGNIGRSIKDVGMLDLRYAKSAEDLAEISSISDVGVILISEDLIGALGRIDIKDVGTIVPIPTNGNVNCMTGQTRLTGEALASGDPETILVLVGQTFITTPVTSVGYKEIRVCGQLFAVRGSEIALTAKISHLTGQNFFLPADHRIVMGEESLGVEFLELLPAGTAFVVMGKLYVDEDVPKALLLEKVQEIVLMGEILAPAHLLASLQMITKEKMGEIKQRDA